MTRKPRHDCSARCVTRKCHCLRVTNGGRETTRSGTSPSLAPCCFSGHPWPGYAFESLRAIVALRSLMLRRSLVASRSRSFGPSWASLPDGIHATAHTLSSASMHSQQPLSDAPLDFGRAERLKRSADLVPPAPLPPLQCTAPGRTSRLGYTQFAGALR